MVQIPACTQHREDFNHSTNQPVHTEPYVAASAKLVSVFFSFIISEGFMQTADRQTHKINNYCIRKVFNFVIIITNNAFFML